MKKLMMMMVWGLMMAAVLQVNAQGVKPLPSIHQEGKWLVDQYGNHVVLHGVMDTPSAYFNGGRWGWSYDDAGRLRCLDYFEKLFTGLEKAKCNVFRLHLEPAWTNGNTTASGFTTNAEGKTIDPIGQEVSGEADISHFSEARLKTYLETLYVPLMQKAMNHGMYVVVRPPGVCPHEIRVDGYYQKYLITVWDIVTKNEAIRAYAGQISLELANEPVSVKNASGNNDSKALHDFFQPIVEKMRGNGFTGIIWIPGSGWQSGYADYKTYPITGDNIGYAVHDYDGWYGCADKEWQAKDVPARTQAKIQQFHNQVPVVDTNPIIVTEIDWSPFKEGTGHYNEHGDWVLSNYGTWATGRTSVWGQITKNVYDHYGNISMTLSGTACLIDIDKLLNTGQVTPAFGGLEEACGKACMDWYAEYYKVNWPHADYACDVPVSDNGNGTYTNPVVRADIPDPDVIRVGDTYYMVSTTMVHFPGATILKSKDMVNWEYCANPLEKLTEDDSYKLQNGKSAYAKGMWACSMKYNDGKFYILINGNSDKAWLLTATDPEGKWTVKRLSRNYYDPGMLFDGDKVYIVCGINHLEMCELDANFNFKTSKTVVIRDDAGLEGCHLYKKGDYYYIYATYGGWPSGQVVFRSTDPFGTYEEKVVVEKNINGQVNTIHQGSLIEDTKGKWWTIMQQDLGALGRFPNLQPVNWVDGWPIVGDNGKPYKTFTKPAGTNLHLNQMATTDLFRNFPLDMQWEWNHLPNANGYSLFVRPGWLRLNATSTTTQLALAQNTLTQRIFAHEDKPTIGTVKLDVTRLAEGDRAGICIFQDPYAQVGVERKNGEYKIYWRQDALDGAAASTKEQYASATVDSIVYLRASIAYSTSKTKFYYSMDNKTWTVIGGETSMSFNLSVFVGARFGLFCYATNGTMGGGSADFDWFSTEDGFDEDALYQPFTRTLDETMFTATKLTPAAASLDMKIGALCAPRITATFKDGHTENVSSQVTFQSASPDVVEIYNGQLRGLTQGSSVISASYTDILGNTLETQFTANATFFPFGADDVTVFTVSGSYTETNHKFIPGKNGRVGWKYDTPIDISDYQYLVVELKAAPSTVGSIYIFPSKVNSVYYRSGTFTKPTKQFVIDLKEAKYTSAKQKGKPVDLTDIQSISISSDGSGTGVIFVDKIFLSNDSQYAPTGIAEVTSATDGKVDVYTLSGQLLRSGVERAQAAQGLPAGIYVIGGKKTIIK